MNILLHICCAPCAINPIEEMREEGHAVSGFFYNPNIHPYSEYLKRRGEVERYAAECGVKVAYGDYDVEDYFRHIVYNEALKKDRCPVCWWLRMERTARRAKENSFDSFTTTLLGSPYQDQDIINNICADVAKKAGLRFYQKDFRAGFKEAHQRARSTNMYCQNYCGCIFSERERFEKRKT